MSEFWISCGAGLLALPLKLRGAARSAASRIEASVIVTGASTVETREAGGSGGNCASAGFVPPPGAPPRGETQSMIHRLAKNEITRLAAASTIVDQTHPRQAPR